ncbi:hypothetical protein PR202_gb24495 [Eleusine coracana subsp. coracana]|uniref:DUF7705 domain-containing protein n=1 Tax=Eleusine coracana subsp. coracana TaxID=191504 RepID=A0AAV5FMJ3_ELECO|nr:hypothetical protein PR202_gb24495 [Eleusine coracana subsp. coracana]
MAMLKNGNLDTTAALCPENGRPRAPVPADVAVPVPGGAGCMNQPLVSHSRTALDGTGRWWRAAGVFGTTYELDGRGGGGARSRDDVSYYERVLGGGYHYDTRGMTKIVPESPEFKVRLTLEVQKGGGGNSQFYLLDMGSCWKNDGRPCDGDGHGLATDVTGSARRGTFRNGTRVHRSERARFPYAAYHVYCSPGNARHAERPTTYCDAYSNPQPQEILQLVPHPVWGEFGYPTEKGQGWIGDAREWALDAGAMSQALYFYQDPGTTPARRRWTSLDVGTEIYVSDHAEAEWTLSGFDILVPADTKRRRRHGRKESATIGERSLF